MRELNRLGPWVQMLRPTHWMKSGFCLAALFFGGRFQDLDSWFRILPLLISISLLSSAGYVLNDVLNVAEDGQHPRKKRRPIASGAIAISQALWTAGLLVVIGMAFLWFSYGVGPVLFLCGGYLILTSLYSLVFRSLAVLDVMVLSAGFVVRVLSGAYALELPPTLWLVGCTYSLALLLGFGKRRGEFVLFQKRGEKVGESRGSLRGYSFWLLNALLAASAFFCVAAYFAFAIARGDFWLVGSCFPVAVGVSDYLRMAYRSEVVEAPEALFLKSPFLLASVVFWLLFVFLAQLS